MFLMVLNDAGVFDFFNIFTGKNPSNRQTGMGVVVSDTKRYINIPAYQRPYRWDEEHIKKLFRDYDDNRKGGSSGESKNDYFIGSSVIVNEKEKQFFDVVDGQQRLTTIYLINYVRFLLMRERLLFLLEHNKFVERQSSLIGSLKETYVGLVACDKVERFKDFEKEFSDICNREEENEQIQAEKIQWYKEKMCIADEKDTADETMRERIAKAELFFKDEELSLKYSRDSYNVLLKETLQNTYIEKKQDSTNYELKITQGARKKTNETYIQALITIFEHVWTKSGDNVGQKLDSSIHYVDDILSNLAICVITTENKDDAYKLFEVLNDRSLAVDDLELIKNQYYQYYCMNQNDNDDTKDENIIKLDEQWTEKIFSDCSDRKKKMISFFAATFLTRDAGINFNDKEKYKDVIKNEYLNQYFDGGKAYDYSCVKTAFNAYYAIRIIIDRMGIKFNAERNKVAFESENSEEKSIVSKAFCALIALDYQAVLGALTSVILSVFEKNNRMSDDSFESSFSSYIEELIKNKKPINDEYEPIYRCAYELWRNCYRSRSYETIKSMYSDVVVESVGFMSTDYNKTIISEDVSTKLNDELNSWLNDWKYGNKISDYKMKSLLINLVKCNKTDDGSIQRKTTISLTIGDAANIQLEHLEPEKIDESKKEYYFMKDADSEDRKKRINSYIGNFMILQSDLNNKKDNDPMKDCLKWYDAYKDTFLYQEIADMMKSEDYFSGGVPIEEFFVERSNRLKNYINKLLNIGYSKYISSL